jgi:hypothetical protein
MFHLADHLKMKMVTLGEVIANDEEPASVTVEKTEMKEFLMRRN